ncbi:hypothetical protein FXO38_24701 [Capsicum annuum]|uniref:Uncharacterized protein n=1 Tax=Capsicum annuum TaxID=4072 RepID=A0A2G2ZLI5_CAPAN|nr:hypothetical protein FXO38_24701 [Capsicum annuum]PHT82856.1 hypothetical protein T459_11299 [Capsicum annuum]
MGELFTSRCHHGCRSANLLTSTGNRLNKELDGVASIIKVALDCYNESPTRRTCHDPNWGPGSNEYPES